MNITNIETMDINLLFSIINMKLRNNYEDLDDLCQCQDINRRVLEQRLATAGFEYSNQHKRFNRIF